MRNFYVRFVKRVIDVVISFFALILLSPILLLTMLAIKIDSKGPILFKQERIGKDGKVFRIYKFRSMIVGAEKIGSKNYSFKGDPRVTRVGRFIRATSIDELPQLVNILKGEMSIIGPRPVLTYFPCTYDKYTKEQLKRFEVLPGVTGLAQINGRKGIPWDVRINYDVEYVEKVSFWLDVKIFFKTIYNVIFMKDNINTIQTNQNIATEEKKEVVNKEEC